MSYNSKYEGWEVEELIDSIVDKVDKVDGKQLSTEDFTTVLKQKLEGLSNYDDTAIQEAISGLQTQINTLVSGDASTAIESFNEIIAFLDGVEDTEDLASIIASIEQQIANKYTKPSGGIPKTDLESSVQTSLGKADTALQEHQSLEDYVKDTDLSAVAKSGSYNDLSNKPTIPTAVTESTVSGWGFTKNTGTYSKPSGGIPKSDLASAVQTSLGKADTALQSYTEQYKGTVTGVKMNGTTKNPSSGVVDLGTVITAHQDLSGYQPKLVSGTNIKTINGNSILGSGNIEIVGGGSIPVVEVSGSVALQPNTFTIVTSLAPVSQNFTLATPTDNSIYNEYMVQFDAISSLGEDSALPSFSFPAGVIWLEEPVFEKNYRYQISIVNNVGLIVGVPLENDLSDYESQ